MAIALHDCRRHRTGDQEINTVRSDLHLLFYLHSAYMRLVDQVAETS